MTADRRTSFQTLIRAVAWALGCMSLLLGPLDVARANEPVARLTVGGATLYDTLDPHVVLDTRRSDTRLHLYDGLFRWQSGPLRIAPWLAQSYTVSEDGRTFRFALRKDARFHNGREVKASDVVYSVERILAQKGGVAPLLVGLVSPGSTKAIDANTVEFGLSRASPLFLTLLPEIHIVNAELLKANELNNDWGRGWLQQNDAGSGAYALKSYGGPTNVLLERFAGHWSTDWSAKPVEEIEFKAVLDPEARVDRLIAGELQVLQGNLLPHQLQRLRDAKDVVVLPSDGPRIFVGILNSGRDPIKVPGFRKVLAQAFDSDRFIASALGNGATAITLPLPPSIGTPPPGLARPKFDLAEAAAGLAKLKLPTRELTIGAIAGDPHSERAALIMLDGLIALGLPARIVSEVWPVLDARMRDEKQTYDIVFLWRGARYLDANNWLGEMFDCDLLGAGNSSWYCNRDIDRAIKEARAIADPRARRTAFEKAAQLLAEDHAGLFIASARRTVAHAKKVKGLRHSPVGEAIDARMAIID